MKSSSSLIRTLIFSSKTINSTSHSVRTFAKLQSSTIKYFLSGGAFPTFQTRLILNSNKRFYATQVVENENRVNYFIDHNKLQDALGKICLRK